MRSRSGRSPHPGISGRASPGTDCFAHPRIQVSASTGRAVTPKIRNSRTRRRTALLKPAPDQHTERRRNRQAQFSGTLENFSPVPGPLRGRSGAVALV
jgi:hypothetical protein